VQSGQRTSSAPVPPQGAPGGSGQLGTPTKRSAHWAPSRSLGCLSEPPPQPPISPPPQPPISPPLALQVEEESMGFLTVQEERDLLQARCTLRRTLLRARPTVKVWVSSLGTGKWLWVSGQG